MAKEEEKKENIIKKLLKRKKFLFVIIVILVGGLVYWRVIKRKNAEIETAEIKRGTVAEELILSGEIKADEHANLSFSTSGKIIWVGVSEGEWVKKGQALAKLDTDSLNSTYQRALSDLRSAQATVDRVHDDVKDNDEDENYTEKESRTTAEVAKDKAWEAVLIAEENLRGATLLAPFEGLITFVASPYSGINVLFSATQFELVNPETIYFDVTADQSEVVDLRQDQKVVVIIDSFSETELQGEIAFISYTPKSGEAGTVYKVKVIFNTDDVDVQKLKIGMTGDAKFILSQKGDALYIPSKFLNSDSKGKYVGLGEKNNKVYVDVGLEGEEMVEISGEIEEGDIVYD